MIKQIRRTLILIWFLTLITFLIPQSFVTAEGKVTSVLGASYTVQKNVETNSLRSGITHFKDVGLSMTKGTTEYLPQSVNVLNVPSQIGVKVVNWTMRNTSGWTKATVTDTAKNFESLNPGWIVVAAVNGDFFDINGLGALPYQSGGVTVSNGDVLRPIATSTVGYTNNGTVNSMIGGKVFKVSSHKLAIYNDQNEIIATYPIDKLNSAPGANETSLYYTYPVINDEVRSNITKTTPNQNSYLILNQEQGLAMGASNFYGKGLISNINEEKTLLLGQFALVSNNHLVQETLTLGTKVRVQQDVVGDYAECDNIVGVGFNLVNDSEPVASTNRDRHPRTIIGKKPDGTLVFVTVDGRQATKDMHGVIYDEMSALMLHYGCSEAYNIDGGGSTTMILREGNKFRVVNSPSDGAERRDSNALLIVVPALTLTVPKVLDKSVVIKFNSSNHDVIFKNISVTVNGETKSMVDNEISFCDLEPKTEYLVNYSYQMTYQGKDSNNNGEAISFKTGKIIPTVPTLYYRDDGKNYIITYEINDPDETIILTSVVFGTDLEFIKDKNGTFTLDKTKVDSEELIFKIISNIDSSPNERLDLEFKVPLENTTQPKSGCAKQKTNILYNFSMVTTLLLGLYFVRKRK